MMKKLLIAAILISQLISNAQNTVGTTFATPDVYDAYTLFTVNTKTYLINNCGETINEWTSTYLPGNAVYLLPNGNLLRAGQINDGSSNITLGGQGGIVELFNWDGTLLWSYVYSSNQFRQHHDIYPMPNGNILILAATAISDTEAIDAGRDPNLLNETRLYNEQIIEVEPVGTNQANIVWEWNVIDHLVQDFDNTKSNFGVVSLSPEKLDINFLNGLPANANWLHFNSIQYDATLDQIVMSSRNLSEIYIIDHSTTTLEAASNSGGTYGKGGDFLYRWGNPQAYQQGTESDRVLYGQHYPHYIPSGLNDAGKIIVFNNGNGRFPEYSEAGIFNPPTTAPGVYSLAPDSAYEPATFEYAYADLVNDPSEFYSSILSSAQRLPNGNTLICEGRKGKLFEIDSNENIVWTYINPIRNNTGTSTTQGSAPPIGNNLFRAIKYAPEHPAFVGRDLTPGSPLELNPDLSVCENLSAPEVTDATFKVVPNPTTNHIAIHHDRPVDKVVLYSVLGKNILESHTTQFIDVSSLKAGIYIIQIVSGEQRINKKLIKN